MSLTSPFGFENGSGEWAYLYEETGCGDNQIGWADRQTPAVGIIFGLLPADRAARLDPATLLRSG